ncbi:ZIP zinc/iron transport family [Linderina pennispora]|uniref:ZIP zinc/iron transport family n=1 Tax=Linderina pennispora TaxID=61395 RepID=A0A1Y1VYD9_9FUNG|nr:ZIP zinc/iron transport family [Linderina pennispora]ORX65834.1 ZIP zinc/iron transport family [Linderina pennispora]
MPFRKNTSPLLALAAISLVFLQTAAAATTAPRQLLLRHSAGDHSHSEEETDCYASGVDDWSSSMHIAAIFIVLGVGGLGSMLPIISHYMPGLHVSPSILTLGKFLGTGVIISTALIHMLPAGSDSLGNPCIGSRMGNYSGWPGVLVIMAIFAMHLIEFLLSNHTMDGHSHSHGLPGDLVYSAEPEPLNLESQIMAHEHNHHSHLNDSSNATTISEVEQKPDMTPPVHESIGFDTTENNENCDAVAVHTHHNHVHGLSFVGGSEDSIKARKIRISTYILELGICLHSVIIGVTLSVTVGSEFKTLLIAIAFHQFCEGLALGSRLAQIKYARHSFIRAFISAAMFMLITPIGMCIGIGVRYSYAPNSPSALITMGVLDCLSAGILIYSGLVNLLAEEFGTLEFRSYKRGMKTACFIAMFVGAAIMAVIGKWA